MLLGRDSGTNVLDRYIAACPFSSLVVLGVVSYNFRPWIFFFVMSFRWLACHPGRSWFWRARFSEAASRLSTHRQRMMPRILRLMLSTKNPHRFCLLYTPALRRAMSQNVWEEFHGVMERYSELHMSSSAFEITVLVAYRLNRRLNTPVYIVIVPPGRLRPLLDRVNSAIIAKRARPDKNSLKSKSTASSSIC